MVRHNYFRLANHVETIEHVSIHRRRTGKADVSLEYAKSGRGLS